MSELTTNQKGLIAETAIIREAVRLGIVVSRPLSDERYDLILDLGAQLMRVQCKWAVRQDNVIVARCYTSRRGPNGMIVRRYTAAEIDAYGLYCAELDRCFLLPFERFAGKRIVHLRLAPSRNNQTTKINLANEYDLSARLRAILSGP